MWRTEYDEHGGYDCMSGAYKIIGPGDCIVCLVDLADHQRNEQGDWLNNVDQGKRAKYFAELIVACLNGDNIIEACQECEEHGDD